MQVGVVLSLGDLVDTDDRRTFAALAAHGIVTADNQRTLLTAVSPIIEQYKSGIINSEIFAGEMREAILGITGEDILLELEEKEPDWLQNAWNAMSQIDEGRSLQLKQLLANPSIQAYLYSNTNPWHFEKLGGRAYLQSLGLKAAHIFTRHEMGGADPCQAALRRCQSENAVLIHLATPPRTSSVPHQPDQIRYEQNLKKFTELGFTSSEWPRDYLGPLEVQLPDAVTPFLRYQVTNSHCLTAVYDPDISVPI